MAAAILAPVSTALAVAVSQPVIKFVGEARPFVSHPNALGPVSRSNDAGFPSDHATMAGAVATALFLVSRPLGAAAAGCAFLMAAARVYVGVHYPGDVAAGLALGAAVALTCRCLLRTPTTRLVEAPRSICLRVLVVTQRPAPSKTVLVRPVVLEGGHRGLRCQGSPVGSSWRLAMVGRMRWIAVGIVALSLLAVTASVPASAVPVHLVADQPQSGAQQLVVSRHPCGKAGPVPATYRHVIWIWMENKTYSEVIGSSAAPYLTRLAHRCATARHYADAGARYNSLSNYIAATSGRRSCSGRGCPAGTVTTWNDCQPSATCHARVNNLFRQVRRTGGTAKSYQESMSRNCQLTRSGLYAPKHNPAAYYTGSSDRRACRRDDVPMGTPKRGAFHRALASNRSLPTFSFVTPNLCHDTHDCSIATGDAWLANWLPRIMNSPAYTSGRTAIMVTYDEDTPCPNVFIAPTIKPHSKSSRRGLGHYALLRTTEQLLGISHFLGRAARAPSFRSVFRF